MRFVNDDGDIHTASQVGGGFESGLLFSHDAWTYRFDQPGTYEGQAPGSTTARRWRQNLVGIYAQDDWAATRALRATFRAVE